MGCEGGDGGDALNQTFSGCCSDEDMIGRKGIGWNGTGGNGGKIGMKGDSAPVLETYCHGVRRL